MSRSSSSTSVRALDRGNCLATVPMPAPTSKTSSVGRMPAADTSSASFWADTEEMLLELRVRVGRDFLDQLAF